MPKENLGDEAGKALQDELDGMPDSQKKVSFVNVKTTLDPEIDIELGQEVRFSGAGYVKHIGVDWIEGEDGKRPVVVVQVNDVRVTTPKA